MAIVNANALIAGQGGSVNYCQNPRNEGAVVGIIGSGGAYPTYHSDLSLSGLTASVVNVGVDPGSGMAYYDVRYFGTSNGPFVIHCFNNHSLAPVAAGGGIGYTLSLWMAVVGGIFTNVAGVWLQHRWNNGSPPTASGPNIGSLLTPILQQFSYAAISSPGTANIDVVMYFQFAVGAAIDVTLRFGAQQYETGLVVTPQIWPPAGSPGVTTRGLIAQPAGPWLTASFINGTGRTNYGRNILGLGGTPGVLGSGGVAPTEWSINAVAGCTVEFQGAYISPEGIPMTRWRFLGTTTNSNPFGINWIRANPLGPHFPPTVVVISYYYRLYAGSLAGFGNFQHWGDGYDANNVAQSYPSAAWVPQPNANLNRTSATLTFNPSGTAPFRIQSSGGVFYTTGVGAVIDCTLEIGGWQIEDISLTSMFQPLPGTVGPVTRAIDAVSNQVYNTAIAPIGGVGQVQETDSAFTTPVLIPAGGGQTNWIYNPNAEGAVVGVIGSGGVMPTDWSVSSTANGWSFQVIGTGIDSSTGRNLPYIDVRIFGTPTFANNTIRLGGSPGSIAPGIPSFTGDAWTQSVYVGLVAGSINAGTQLSLVIYALNSAGGSIGGWPGVNFTPSATLQQISNPNRTLALAGVARAQPTIQIAQTVGPAIDFTIRIATPQLERSPVVTPLILPPAGSPNFTTRGILAMPAAPGVAAIGGTGAVSANGMRVVPANALIAGLGGGKTNYIRNPRLAGASVGVGNSSWPTYWNCGGDTGMSYDVVGTGTEDGMSYIDMRIHGNIVATNCYLLPEGTTVNSPRANPLVPDTLSVFCRISAGSMANISSAQLNVQYRASDASTFLGQHFLNFIPSATGTIGQSRIQTSGTPPALSAYTLPVLYLTWTLSSVGNPVDITIRIGGWQLEWGLGPATPLIYPPPGTLTAWTRGIDAGGMRAVPANALIPGQAGGQLNWIRNPRAEGAVVGTPGTLPTYWQFSGGIGGLTSQIIGNGVDAASGMPYIDVRVFGTTNATGSNIRFENSNFIVANPSDVWSFSVWAALVGGSLTNVTLVQFGLFITDVNGNNIGNPNISLPITLTSTLQRFAINGDQISNNPSIGHIWPVFMWGTAQGAAVDVTFRIGAPQVEEGPFATANILPPPGQPGISASTVTPDSTVFTTPVLIPAGGGSVNSLFNPNCEGAVAGVVGSGGVLPFNWSLGGGLGGTQVVGTGIDATTGLNYVDIRIVQTTTVTATTLRMDTNLAIPAVSADVFSWSGYVALVGGSLTQGNVTIGFAIYATDVNGASVGNTVQTNFVPTATMQRFQVPNKVMPTVATTRHAWPVFYLTWTNGVAIDFTFRVAGLQLERGTVCTPLFLPPLGSPGVTARALQASPNVFTTPWTTTGVGSVTASALVRLAASTTLQGAGQLLAQSNVFTTPVLIAGGGGSINWNPNPRLEGAVAGTIGSGGAWPTGWAQGSIGTGLTCSLALGTEGNLPYLDITISGTTTGTPNGLCLNIGLGTQQTTRAAPGDAWAHSLFMRLMAGTLPSANGASLMTYELDASYTAITYNFGAPANFQPSNAPLAAQRYVNIGTVPDATARYVDQRLWIYYSTTGQVVNFTLRIASPQFERSTVATPLIWPLAGQPGVTARALIASPTLNEGAVARIAGAGSLQTNAVAGSWSNINGVGSVRATAQVLAQAQILIGGGASDLLPNVIPTQYGGNTCVFSTDVPSPDGVSPVMKHTANIPFTQNALGAQVTVGANLNVTYTVSVWVYIPSSWDGSYVQMQSEGAITGTAAPASMSLRDQWQFISFRTNVPTANFQVALRTGTPTNGLVLYSAAWTCTMNEVTAGASVNVAATSLIAGGDGNWFGPRFAGAIAAPNTWNISTDIAPPPNSTTPVYIHTRNGTTGDSNTGYFTTITGAPLNVVSYSLNVSVWLPAGWGGTELTFRHESGGIPITAIDANLALTNQWQVVTLRSIPILSNLSYVCRPIDATATPFYTANWQAVQDVVTAGAVTAGQIAALIAGSGSLSAQPSVRMPDGAAITGAGNVIANAQPMRAASASMAGVGSLTATTTVRAIAGASIAGLAGLTATATDTTTGAARIAGLAGYSFTGGGLQFSYATFNGAGSFTVSPYVLAQASVRIAGAAGFANTVQQFALAGSGLSGLGAVLANATRVAQTRIGNAEIDGAGSVTATVIARRAASASIAGAGGVSLTTQSFLPAFAQINGAGGVHGNMLYAGQWPAFAEIDGEGWLTVVSGAIVQVDSGVCLIHGLGDVDPPAGIATLSGAVIAGRGAVYGPSSAARPGRVEIDGTGNVIAKPLRDRPASATIAGVGGNYIVTIVHEAQEEFAAIDGAGSLRARGSIAYPVAARIAGQAAVAAPLGRVLGPVHARIAGLGDIDPTPRLRLTAAARLGGLAGVHVGFVQHLVPAHARIAALAHLAAQAWPARHAQARLAGVGRVQASGAKRARAGMETHGLGHVTADAHRLPRVLPANAHIAGLGGVRARPGRVTPDAARIAAVGALHARAHLVLTVLRKAIHGDGAVWANPHKLAYPVSASIHGAGSLRADAHPRRRAQARIAGLGHLSDIRGYATAGIHGLAHVRVIAFRWLAAHGVATGTGTIHANPVVHRLVHATAQINGTGTLHPDPYVPRTRVAILGVSIPPTPRSVSVHPVKQMEPA